MVTAVELESGTGGTSTLEIKTESQLLTIESWSQEAGVHQSVSALDDEHLIVVCLTFRQQHKEDQNFEVTTEPWLLSLGDRVIELQRLKLSPPVRVMTHVSRPMTMMKTES